jgi:PAS domain S-box-containing protein
VVQQANQSVGGWQPDVTFPVHPMSQPEIPQLHFRQMLDALPAPIYSTDAEGRLTYFNPAAVEFSGRVPQLGTDRWCISWKLYGADGSPMAHGECPMAIALREGREVRDVEIIVERPDGIRRWCVPWPTPIRDAEGRVTGGINMLVDITEQKHAERASILLASIVDSTDDAVVSKNLNGIITSWNTGAERLFGYTQHEAIGRPVLMLIPPDRANEETHILSQLRQGLRVDHFDTVRVRKDGTLIDVSLTISPIRDRTGTIIGASKIARDITARKRAESALRETSRQKDEFIATLAHELRNPLAPMRHSLEILNEKGSQNPEVQWARDVLDRQLGTMSRLLEDLLDVARISRNRLELRKERVELQAILKAALETSRPLIEAGGHRLLLDISARPIWVVADPVRLAQVFSNLLNNAAKYTEPGGQIQIALERQAGAAVVAVLDNGIGIPAEMLPQVFEMFIQSKESLLRAQGGLGIGLSLVKGLVELHGGSIEARSAGTGQGSQFIVRLPADLDEVSQPATTTTARPGQVPSRRVVIADDNRDSADTLSRLLKIMGHNVVTAYDGAQAVELAAAHRPELVLLDIGMPKLDGYEACRQIRQQADGGDAYIVALTGWGQEEDRRRTQEAGFDLHLVKPIDRAKLLQALSAVAVK